MDKQEMLKQIDNVIAAGPFKDTWESLCAYTPPEWYAGAKFGIFIHWGVYSVPAFGSEWYPRNMYVQGSPEYEHHLKTYGKHKEFGYKDFIPRFKAEKFDPAEWMDLFKKSGAKYIMPVAEHHDGFAMYDCSFSKWNSVHMGPKRDVVGELKREADRAGIVFSVSFHRAEHCWFFNGGCKYESDVTDSAYEDFYEKQQTDVLGENTHDIYSAPPGREHCEDWLVRICELADTYQPQIVWFDWWIHNTGWKPYLKKFAAYYYNRARSWGKGVAINYKYNAYVYGSAVFDVERGQLAEIRPRLWQTDTAAAKNSWGYTENNDFKNPVDIVCDLVDIVSKNGVLLLNIGPRPDGSITGEDRRILLSVGEWLDKNGEGIYDTTYWQQFGEGPTKIIEGAFKDVEREPFTPQDFRFTYKNGVLYAFVMKFPKDGKIAVPSLGSGLAAVGTGAFDIVSVRLLGYSNRVSFARDRSALSITVEGSIQTEYPVGFAIQLN
ncbi:MAG: alpha-L-fucosidase [Treponema sp.]|jgi:alpha-L-fucosidase|nr:alpha-L-fucosidase [Treponema sp.]